MLNSWSRSFIPAIFARLFWWFNCFMCLESRQCEMRMNSGKSTRGLLEQIHKASCHVTPLSLDMRRHYFSLMHIKKSSCIEVLYIYDENIQTWLRNFFPLRHLWVIYVLLNSIKCWVKLKISSIFSLSCEIDWQSSRKRLSVVDEMGEMRRCQIEPEQASDCLPRVFLSRSKR